MKIAVRSTGVSKAPSTLTLLVTVGVRRAIGAPRASVMAQFLGKTAVVCGTGGVIGIGLGMYSVAKAYG